MILSCIVLFKKVGHRGAQARPQFPFVGERTGGLRCVLIPPFLGRPLKQLHSKHIRQINVRFELDLGGVVPLH